MAQTIEDPVIEYFKERGWSCDAQYGTAIRIIRGEKGSKILHRVLPGLWKADYFDETGRGHNVCEGPDPITVYVQAEIAQWLPT